MAKIRVLKLTSGEEIIGSVSESKKLVGGVKSEGNNTVRLENVRTIMVAGVQNNQVALALIPFMNSCIEEAIEINADQIVAMPTTVRDDIEKAYLQQISKIEIAGAGALSQFGTGR